MLAKYWVTNQKIALCLLLLVVMCSSIFTKQLYTHTPQSETESQQLQQSNAIVETPLSTVQPKPAAVTLTNPVSKWQSALHTNQDTVDSIGVAFGKYVYVRGIKIKPYRDQFSVQTQGFPTDFSFQYSSNGNYWRDIENSKYNAYAIPQGDKEIYFGFPQIRAKAIRIVATRLGAITDSKFGMVFSDFRPDYTPYNGVSEIVSSTHTSPTWQSDHLIDGRKETMFGWSSVVNPEKNRQEYAGLDMGKIARITSFTVVPRYNYITNSLACFPEDFKLQFSVDGQTWTTITNHQYAGYTKPRFDIPITFTFNNVQARFIRLLATKLSEDGQGNTALQFSEIYAGSTENLNDPTLQYEVEIAKPKTEKPISKNIWGVNYFNFALPNVNRPAPHFGVDLALTSSAGIKMLRFMGGCPGDFYNWKTAKQTYRWNGRFEGVADVRTWTVDEALEIARIQGAELLFQVNVETKNRINPCGNIPRNYCNGDDCTNMSDVTRKKLMIQDAADLVQAYKGRIKYFELGNEQWGSWVDVVPEQSKLKIAEAIGESIEFAQAMKSIDPTIKVGIVGHPTTGNNQTGETNNFNDAYWTSQVREAIKRKCGVNTHVTCFDFVTDHPYFYTGYNPGDNNNPANFPGLSAYYTSTRDIDYIFRKREADYAPLDSAKTEWSLKTWTSERFKAQTVPLINQNFDLGGTGWNLWSRIAGTGSIISSPEQKVTGSNSMKVVLDKPSQNPWDAVQASQVFSTAGHSDVVFTEGNLIKKRKPYKLNVWVYTNSPKNTRIILQQINDGTHKYHHIAESVLSNIKPNTWQKVELTGYSFEDTTQMQVVFRTLKSQQEWVASPEPVIAYFDAVTLENRDFSKVGVPSSGTVEHGMFVFEVLMKMVEHGVDIANLHAYGIGGQGLFKDSKTLNPIGQAFNLSSSLAGGSLLSTNRVGVMPYMTSPRNSGCISNCIPGGIPLDHISVYSGTNAQRSSTYIYIVNKHSSKSATIQMMGNGLNLYGKNAIITTLKAGSYTDKVFTNSQSAITLLPGTISVEPLTVTRIEIKN